MAHIQQVEFCTRIKNLFPNKFKNCDVLDIGSLDINGNNRYLFENYTYTGVDIGEGPNVDVVSLGHEFNPDKLYDVVISTEAFEHDQHWEKTIQNCVSLTKPLGLFMFTCASRGRPEHGTSRSLDWASPFSHIMFNDYYRNLNEEDIDPILPEMQYKYFEYNAASKDLYFYGIK